jgi:hypothetical protein
VQRVTDAKKMLALSILLEKTNIPREELIVLNWNDLQNHLRANGGEYIRLKHQECIRDRVLIVRNMQKNM